MTKATDPLDFSLLPDVSAEHPELDAAEQWSAAHMKAREAALEHIFGPSEPEGKILSPSDPQLTINWPGGGIYQYPPRDGRRGWHYVTHGLAQPLDEEEVAQWEGQPQAYSGFGIELVISTPELSDWAPGILLDMVRYLLFTDDARLILAGDRIPYRGIPKTEGATPLAFLLATTSPEYATEILLPAGHCSLVHLVGVTKREIERVRSCSQSSIGSDFLVKVLEELGPGLVTQPDRPCLTEHERFNEIWSQFEFMKRTN